MKKAAWSLVVLVPAGAAAVWFATRDSGTPATPQGTSPDQTAVTTSTETPAKKEPEAWDPGKPTPEVRAERKAIEDIGKAAQYSPENEAKLIKALDHFDQDVRGHGAWGIGVLAPQSRGGLPALIKALGDEVWAVQHNAAWSLARFERGDTENLLLAALGDPSPTRRIRAGKALLDLSALDFTPKVEAVLLKSFEEAKTQPRTVALQAMGKLSPPSETTVSLLASAVASEQDEVAVNAIQAIGDLGPAAQAAIPALCSAHKHKKQDVRLGVATSLGAIGVRSPIVVETLIAMLDDTKDNPADKAAQSLALLEAWDELDKAFETQGPRTRRFIVTAWRQGASQEARRIERLIAALSDVDPTVRLAAAGGFLERDSAEAVPALVKAMSDSDNAVAGHARSALERMSNSAAKAALAQKGNP